MIRFTHRGSFNNAERFLSRARNKDYNFILRRHGEVGLQALRQNTPKDSGVTAESWRYVVERKGRGFTITWLNSNVVDGVPIVILLQYGHGTRSGSYVQGRDFINPAMRPIFDKIAEDLWKEVTNL